MPAPHRLAPDVVDELLERWFPAERIIVASVDLSRAIVHRCRERGIGGGAVYDALIGLAAAEAGQMLVTRDGRAARSYVRLDVRHELLV